MPDVACSDVRHHCLDSYDAPGFSVAGCLGEVRLQHELSHTVLCVRVLDRAQEREVAPLAVKR